MNTPTPVSAEESKILAWLKSNWFAYGAGAGSVAVLWYVVHKFL